MIKPACDCFNEHFATRPAHNLRQACSVGRSDRKLRSRDRSDCQWPGGKVFTFSTSPESSHKI
jgi:hypothetical protein